MTTPSSPAVPDVRAPGTIEFVAGSADDVVIPLFDANGAPIDIAGWSARLEVRYAPGHPTLLAYWATDYPAAALRLENSAAVLVVNRDLAEASLAWPWRLAQYDLALRAPNGRPARPHRGIARVIPGITATI
jgi:hypothetical protein